MWRYYITLHFYYFELIKSYKTFSSLGMSDNMSYIFSGCECDWVAAAWSLWSSSGVTNKKTFELSNGTFKSTVAHSWDIQLLSIQGKLNRSSKCYTNKIFKWQPWFSNSTWAPLFFIAKCSVHTTNFTLARRCVRLDSNLHKSTHVKMHEL